MTYSFNQEIKGPFQVLRKNFNEVAVLSSAALFLSLDNYYPIWNSWFSSLIYFAVLPVLIIFFVLHRNPLDYGFQLGDIRVWSRHVGIFCLIAGPVLFLCTASPEFQKYYHIQNFNFLAYLFTTSASLFGSEFLFRGFLIFGLKEKFKEASILIQMIPFVLVHFGKPGLETVSTIFTGLIFGYIVYRGCSFWPALIIHLFINLFFVALINLL